MYSLIDKDVLLWSIPKIRENLKNHEDNERVRKYDRWLIEELDELKKLPVKGIYSIPEMNIYNVSFSELITKIIT